jgi:FixJ family two-component response regulator
MADALCQNMMPSLIQPIEPALGPHCTREQARELLEALRAAYQSLSPADRGLVKNLVSQMERRQLLQEMEQEKRCFESVS